MGRAVGLKRPKETELVNLLSKAGHHVGHPHPTLARLLEIGDRGHQTCRFFKPLRVGVQLEWDLLARFALKSRLVVEQIHLRWTTLHPKQDDALGFRFEMRRLGAERILCSRHHGLFRRHGCHSHGTEATTDRSQKTTPRSRKWLHRMEHDRYLLYRNSLETRIA